MKIETHIARAAKETPGYYFQLIRKYPVPCAIGAAALVATPFAFEFEMKGPSSVESSRNSTPASAEKPVVLPNLDSLSPMGEGNGHSD
jgi:hypothetical protein